MPSTSSTAVGLCLRDRVHAVLNSHDCDEVIVDYVTGLLETSEEDMDGLQDGLRAVVESVSESHVDEIVNELVGLLRTEHFSSGDVLGEDINAVEDQYHSYDEADGREKEQKRVEDEFEELEDHGIESTTESSPDDVIMLLSLLGFDDSDILERQVVERILQEESHDVQMAADRLLQMQSSGALGIELNIEKKKKRREQQGPASPVLDDAIKATIVSQYHLVPNGTTKAMRVEPREETKDTKIRFRDGAVVSTKGEKYIIEKTLPEWDGGSRGRVKMKGKRGTGWV